MAALRSGQILQQDKQLVTDFKAGTRPEKIAKKLKDAGPIPTGHLRLAALFSSRTQYTSSARRLSLGTVVRFRPKHSKASATPWQYAVCLVPECDSLRLRSNLPTQLPFWTVEPEQFTGNLRRNGMVLASCCGGHISLSASGKAGDKFWTDSFRVDEKTKTVMASRLKATYRYEGTKRTIEWLGQLKPLHAHRIAHEITDGLSRIGVSEAEWLRLLCDRN